MNSKKLLLNGGEEFFVVDLNKKASLPYLTV